MPTLIRSLLIAALSICPVLAMAQDWQDPPHERSSQDEIEDYLNEPDPGEDEIESPEDREPPDEFGFEEEEDLERGYDFDDLEEQPFGEAPEVQTEI